MNAQNVYTGNIEELNIRIAGLEQRKRRFELARLISFIAAGILFFAFLEVNGILATILAIILLCIFLFVTHKDIDNLKKLQFLRRLLTINEEEIKAFNGDFSFFDDGHQFIDPDHSYANDLDIFGKHSLFQFINRTTADPSADLLAGWLSKPATKEQILQRQQAVKALQPETDWRQNLQAKGREAKMSKEACMQMISWSENEEEQAHQKFWSITASVVLASSIMLIILAYVNILPWKILWISFCLHLFLTWRLNKIVSPVYHQLSKTIKPLNAFYTSLEWILTKSFSDPYLQSLQQCCYHNKVPAHELLNRLKNILDRLDLRLNWLVHLPLNFLIFWDWQQYKKLQQCRTHIKGNLSVWINTLAEAEVLSSFANLSFNHPEWCFPEIADQHFTFSAVSMGHPLIPENKRVDNNAGLKGTGKIMLVTGSNMAGKSTFLRTVGVNIVLAMAGAPVCAKEMEISRVSVLSSMRIADNLEENISTFYAELKKLETIIQRVRANEKVLLLLDEILRGTNSNDRHAGSRALIHQLLTEQAVSIVATHDLALTNMEEEYNGQVLNYHFDVQVCGEELFFDYKLKPGICTSMNASLLMRKIGINM